MKSPTSTISDTIEDVLKRHMMVVCDSRSPLTSCVKGIPFSAEVQTNGKNGTRIEKETKGSMKRKRLSCSFNDSALAPEIDLCDDATPKKRRRMSTESSEHDLIVVLDMDECLIHSGNQNDHQTSHNISKSSACTEDEDRENVDTNNLATEDSTVIHINGNMKVSLRPGLIEFLKYVTARFQTHIFTAGTKEYADSILDQLSLLVGNEDAFSKRWYRGDCDTIYIMCPFTFNCIESIYVKPLSKVAEWAGRDAEDLRRIVHIDDQGRNFLLNPGNGIRVSEWRGNPNDAVLSQVTKVLQKIDTDDFGDVRPHLRGELSLMLKNQLSMINLFPHRRTKGIA